MKQFVFLSAVLVLCNGRPQGQGYVYSKPSNAAQASSVEAGAIPQTQQLPLQQSSNFNTQQGNSIQTPQSYQSITQVHQQQQQVSQADLNARLNIGPVRIIQNQGQAELEKSIYVHVAPEDHEPVRPQRIIQLGNGRRHLQVIFVKAPAAPKPATPVVSLAPQSEGKTLVYVLVKKPEAPKDVVIPASAGLKQNKPEVVFIKYNTKEEAENAIRNAGVSLNEVTAHGNTLEQALGQKLEVQGAEVDTNAINEGISYEGARVDNSALTGSALGAVFVQNGEAHSTSAPAPVYGAPGQL